MICPACNKELVQKEIEDITVDICEGNCGGVWFDNYELDKVDEKHESAGEELLDIKRDPTIKVDHTKERICPVCQTETKMLKHFFSVKMKVEIDECPRCGGTWLDYGELGEIRNLYNTEGDRKEAARNYFNQIFKQEFEQLSHEREEKSEKTQKFAKMFRFICPSYYIPGKQDWGAF